MGLKRYPEEDSIFLWISLVGFNSKPLGAALAASTDVLENSVFVDGNSKPMPHDIEGITALGCY